MLDGFDINLLYQVAAVAVALVATYVLGRIAASFLKATFKKVGIPETETVLVASIVKYGIYLVGILVALNYVGVDVISVWIALALGVLIIGIAARSALDNVISGYFLRTYGPFDVGDLIEIEGRTGVVKDLTLLKTVLETKEHFFFSIPNSKVMQSELYNFTRYKNECPVKLRFEVAQEADLDNVRLEILGTISSYTKLSYEKPIHIYVQRFSEKGVILKVLFFVPDLALKQVAKDFVATNILRKSKSGVIPLWISPKQSKRQDSLQTPEKARVHNSSEERTEDKEDEEDRTKPKCPNCDSHKWHGFLRCRTCGSYFVFGKCKSCDGLRLEKCPVDDGELEYMPSKLVET